MYKYDIQFGGKWYCVEESSIIKGDTLRCKKTGKIFIAKKDGDPEK